MPLASTPNNLQKRSEKLLQITGRRPRILLAHINNEISSIQLKALAVVFANAGFDVDIGPDFFSHAAVAKMACENDVHVVGIPWTPADRCVMIRDLTSALAEFGENDIKVCIGKEKMNNQLLENYADFEEMAERFTGETLTLIGA